MKATILCGFPAAGRPEKVNDGGCDDPGLEENMLPTVDEALYELKLAEKLNPGPWVRQLGQCGDCREKHRGKDSPDES